MKKSRNEIFLVVLLWSVVVYAVALLTFCTKKYVFEDGAEFISAFGTYLGAIGTFFAACVAAYLFTDWKDQARYESNKESSMKLLEHLSSLRYNLTLKIDALNSLKKLDICAVIKDEFTLYKLDDDESVHEFFFKNRHHAIFLNKRKSKDTENLFTIYLEISKHFINIAMPYSIIIHDYNRYYSEIMAEIDIKKLNYNYKVINRSYNFFGIKKNVFLTTKIISSLRREAGYHEYDNANNITNTIKYNNLSEMINSTLDKIDILESELIRINNFEIQ